tara:strand:+ start:178 stop:516 length:339 start_codon:yes stop_codon:yes gene_type:complete
MKRNKVIISLIITLVFITGAQNFASGEAPTLKFPTEEVRAMWYMCSTQFQMVAPHIAQAERVRLCDCYVDHMRDTFTPKQVEALTPEQAKELGIKMNIICPTQQPFIFKGGT